MKIVRIVNWDSWSLVEIKITDAGERRIIVYDKPNAEIAKSDLAVGFCGFGLRPVAMFEPTERGWMLANEFCLAQIEKEQR